MNFATLPNLIALSMLVAVFWAISRKTVSEQVQLWLIGWALALGHFAAEFPAAGQGTAARIAGTASLDSLFLASVAFLISVSALASSRRRQLFLAIAIAAPELAYLNGLIWEVERPSYYYSLLGIGFLAPFVLFWHYSHGSKLSVVGASLTTSLAAGIIGWGVASGKPELGITVILATLNFAVAVLYWIHYKRFTAGVLTAVGGFALWGAVFPTAILLSAFAPDVKVESEVWNIPKYLVAVGMILTLLEEQIAKTTYLAYHDELTGLPNRRLLEDRLEQALAQARRTDTKVAVFVLDLNYFKEINDNFGHRMGDIALREVTARLSSRLRASDTLARSGGDEFTVVSQVATAQGATILLTDLKSALSDPILIGDRLVQTGLSIGLALYPEDGDDANQLHAVADRAMYTAKRIAHNTEPIGTIPEALA